MINKIAYLPRFMRGIQLRQVGGRVVVLIFGLGLFCLGSTALCARDIQKNYRYIEKDGHQIHLLEIAPKDYKIVLARATPHAYSPVSRIAKVNHAVAAINGGFFHQGGAPAGIQKIGNHWYGFNTLPRAALGWDDKLQRVEVDRITATQNKKSKAITTHPHAWRHLTYIIQGAPLLIKNGRLISDHRVEKTQSSFLMKRHARTAVCIKENQNWLFLVASHTKLPDRPYVEKIAEGLTIPELGQFLLNEGCVHAVNLDGGDSSTMVIQGHYMNKPVGDRLPMLPFFRPRSVSDAILILER